MKRYSIWAAALVLVLAVVGCSSSSDLLDVIVPDLLGTWDYQMTNSATATFSGCTDDLTFLNGMTYDDAVALGTPICPVPDFFQVVQIQGTAAILPNTTIDCSDGSTALLTWDTTLTETTVDGLWIVENLIELNTSTQSFSGTVSGNTIDLDESRLTFTSGLQGSCDLSLRSTVTVTN